jgi:phenylpropionate dioxygenase-like ring-hydroxylating dioxygenase large terminal subunit
VISDLPRPVTAGNGTARFAGNDAVGLERSWYAVAMAHDVRESPVAVQVLGTWWVLVRLDGELVAFEDRCPHRLAPLSIGTVNTRDGADTTCAAVLTCGYHGWSFDAAGRCVDIPSLGAAAPIPGRAALRRPAAVAERYGLVWLAPEPPVCALPDFPEWDDPAYDTMWNEPRRTTAGALQLCENFLDATHIPTVHMGTFGVAGAAAMPPQVVESEGWRAWTTYEITYRNHDDPRVASGVHPLEQPQLLYKEVWPATTALIRLIFPLTGNTIVFLFSCLPESATSTRIFKVMARDDFDGDAQRIAVSIGFEDLVLDEDLAVLEAYRHDGVPLDLRVEVHTRNDKLAVAYRRLLGRLLGGGDEIGSSGDDGEGD